MFNSIDSSDSDEFESIIFGDYGKGKIKGLGKITVSNYNVHLKSVCLSCVTFTFLD